MKPKKTIVAGVVFMCVVSYGAFITLCPSSPVQAVVVAQQAKVEQFEGEVVTSPSIQQTKAKHALTPLQQELKALNFHYSKNKKKYSRVSVVPM